MTRVHFLYNKQAERQGSLAALTVALKTRQPAEAKCLTLNVVEMTSNLFFVHLAKFVLAFGDNYVQTNKDVYFCYSNTISNKNCCSRVSSFSFRQWIYAGVLATVKRRRTRLGKIRVKGVHIRKLSCISAKNVKRYAKREPKKPRCIIMTKRKCTKLATFSKRVA